jgi:RNA recognition motif-containing protein
MNIYIGNLAHQATDADLRQAFEAFGEVASANVIKDKYSGESRGFGFVEMPDNAQAAAAITGLTGKDLKGRTMNVSEAKPRTDAPRTGGGGGGRSGGGGGYGGGGNRSGGSSGSGWSRGNSSR